LARANAALRAKLAARQFDWFQWALVGVIALCGMAITRKQICTVRTCMERCCPGRISIELFCVKPILAARHWCTPI
jgi:hypothetical protein